MSIQSGKAVKVCNDMAHYDGSVDYTFYIEEAEKLVIK